MDIPSLKDKVSPDEWRTRVDLACAYRLIAHFGWDDLIFTHLSARVPGPDEHFLINPLGLMFDEITASSLVKVDIEGNKISPSPWLVNPAGFVIHSCVHKARHDVGAVFHTHSLAGVAVSAQADGLLPISQTALQLYLSVGYHDYEGIALEEDEQPRLVRDLGDNKVMILRNHGILSTGKDIAECFLVHFVLEKACAIQIAAQSGGANLYATDPAVHALVQHQARNSFAPAAALSWAALQRRMDRLDPGYRE